MSALKPTAIALLATFIVASSLPATSVSAGTEAVDSESVSLRTDVAE